MRAAAFGCAGIMLGALDFGLMTVAGPAIDAELRLGGAYPWLFSASSFSYGTALMPAGGLVARKGAGPVLRTGLLVYAAGLVATALAPTTGALLAGRALLGGGGGMVAPAALALLAAVPSGGGRRLAFAGSGGAVATGFLCGVLLGALAEPWIGWRAVLLALCAPVLLLAAPARGAGAAAPGAGAIRPAGVIAVAASASIAAAALSVASRAPLASAGLVAIALLVARAGLRQAARPPGAWIPRPWRAVAAVCAAGAATTASGVGGMGLLGRALPEVAGLSPAATGLLLAAFGMAVPVAVPAARAIGARIGAARCCGVGLTAQCAALAGLAAIPLGARAGVATAIAVFGAGHVVANAGAAQAAMDAAGRHPGPLAGLLATAQYAGAGGGAVVVLAAAGGAAPTAAGVRTGLALAAALALGGALVTALSRSASG